jgi:K+-transporting ATPase ATPase A chain
LQAGGNMEGKEVRFGIAPSSSFATDAGGAVDAMHDSFMPLGGMVLILNMLLGEITFGGVGSGLYGMLAFVVVTMFGAPKILPSATATPTTRITAGGSAQRCGLVGVGR